MSDTFDPYIHTIKEHCYFALRLVRLATLTALGPRPESYPAQLLARQIDWVTCLINTQDEQVTFDLRFISTPDPELYVRGQLAIALLCRLDGVSVAQAMARANLPIEQRRDFYVYADEFQSLATQNFGILLAEAREYRLNLVLTNQFVAQLPSDIIQAIAGNVGTTISFRVGAPDAELMEREFLPTFNRYDLMNLPNFNTYVSTLINGQVSRPFSMQTRPDPTPLNVAFGAEIREKSRQRYAHSRAEVEQEIADSLELTKNSSSSILDWQ